MPSVRDVIWSEIVEMVGRKRSIPSSIIDKLWRRFPHDILPAENNLL